MKNHSEPKPLDLILFEFLTENETPTREALNEWIQRYPLYEQDLLDLAVDWFELTLPLSAGTPIEDDAIVVQRGVDFIQEKMREEVARSKTNPKTRNPFRGFVKEGRVLNLSLDEVAHRVGLTPALLAKIDRRMIRYSSLPLDLLQALAEAVNRDILTSAQFLQAQPAIPSNERFKSSKMPEISEQSNFFDEVRSDPDMSDDERQHWLALEPKK